MVSVHKTDPEHEVAYQELCKLLTKHAGSLDALDVLAIASNVVGKLVAMQDQRTVSNQMAMEVVLKNIELGNQQAIAQLMQSKGSA